LGVAASQSIVLDANAKKNKDSSEQFSSFRLLQSNFTTSAKQRLFTAFSTSRGRKEGKAGTFWDGCNYDNCALGTGGNDQAFTGYLSPDQCTDALISHFTTFLIA